MKINFNTREEKFTSTEFNLLVRNADGDIRDLSNAYPFITDAQREELSDDDHARMIDLDEEMNCLMADARAEFGF